MSIAGLEDYLNREFGELDEGSLERQTGRRASRLLDNAPTSGADVPGPSSGIPEWTPAASSGGGLDGDAGLGDAAKLFAAGTVGVGEDVTGAVEYLARQNKYTRGTGVQEALEGARKGIGSFRESIIDSVDPDAMDRVGREWLSSDPNKTIWQGSPIEFASSVGMKMAQMLPSTLATLAPAAVWFRGMQATKALAYMGASEAGITMGSIANGISNEIEQTPHEELLAGSQRYQQLYTELGNEEAARDQLITEAQGATPAAAAAFVAAISITAGRYLEPVFLKTGAGGGLGLGQRFGRGFLAESAQEGPQSAGEQLATNLSAQLYDNNRNLSEGVAEASVEGAVMGGLTGGGFTAAAGQRPTRPLSPPAVDEGGQMGLPGFGPTVKEQGFGIEPEGYRGDPNPQQQYVPNTGMGQQTEFFPDPGTTDATLVPDERSIPQDASPTEQMVLPMGIARTETLAERGPNHRTLEEGDIVPDEMDQPTAEPVEDIEAQLADMKGASGRSAVYVSPAQRNDNFQIPKGAVIIPNFDGKGGTLIAKNQEAATHARKIRANGGSMQAIIGELTMAGAGKPNVQAGYAVQLVDENGAVARESLVRTKAEANALEKKWKADGTVRVLSGPEALARRGDAIEREQLDLRTEDPALVDQATPDMFPQQPNALTAAENQSTAGDFQVQMTDEQGNEITTETFATQEEADARNDELIKDFPDAFVTSKPTRVAATPEKAGVTVAYRSHPKKVLKGPPEGPPPRPSGEVSTASTSPEKVSMGPSKVDEFDETISVKDIEALPNFEATYSVITNVEQANGSIMPVETRETREFTSRAQAKSYATRMTNKARKVMGPDGTVKEGKVTAISTPELESAFQSALQSRADHKQETTAEEEGKKVQRFESDIPNPTGPEGVTDTSTELKAKYSEQNTAPSQKVQFIRRERASRLQRRGPAPTEAPKASTVRAEREQIYHKAKMAYGKKVTNWEAKNPDKKLPKYLKREGEVIEAERKALDKLRAGITEPGYKQAKIGSQSTTTVDRGGKTRETKTDALVIEVQDGEETSAQQLKRKAAVKEANTRLRFALNRALKFLDRFDTTGEYGTYVENNTNIDSSLNKDAQEFISARAIFHQLVELANSALASGNTSNAHAKMVKQIALALERVKLKSMSPAKFASEFNAVAKVVDKKMLKAVPTVYRENSSQRDKKVSDYNNDNRTAAKRLARLENAWAKDKIWSEIVGPIFRKFSDALLMNIARPATNTYYKPTLLEIEALRYALRTFRKMSARYPTTEFYNPVKDQLRHYGFEFDAEGDVIVQEFSPSEALLASGFIAKHGVSMKVAGEITGTLARDEVPVVPDTTAVREERDKSDRVKAVTGINTANALLSRLKQLVSPAKITVRGIKRLEQRFIRGLRKLGAWTDTAPGMGKISFGGYASRTYRLVGPRLDAKTMSKGEAKGVIDRLKAFAMPRDLAREAKLQENETARDVLDTFIESNSTEFFLEEINLDEYSEVLETASSAVGDLIRDRNTKADANTVLDTLIEQLPADHFYHKLAVKLRALNMSGVTLQYDWTDSKFFGKKRESLGVYDAATQRAYLNARQLSDIALSGDSILGAKAIHTMMHELMHAATVNGLANNAEMQTMMYELRTMARDAWIKENGPKNVPYGLRLNKADGKPMPLDEFVAEVFSNPEIQDHLKGLPVALPGATNRIQAGWKVIKDIIAKILGLENVPNVSNALDAMLSVESELFAEAGVARAGKELLHLDVLDGPLRSTAEALWSKVIQRSGIVQRVKDAGGAVLRNIQTMEQFVENYAKHFMVDGKSMLTQYSKAFNNRNARASEYMNAPQNVSREWTKLEETNPDAALEVSRIGTTASMNRINASVAADHAANEHMNEAQTAVHTELHARYNALSQDAKDVYNAAKSYYAEASKRENLFLLQSALRGILTNSKGIGLDIDVFESKFNVAELGKIESREELAAALNEYIPEEAQSDMIDLIYRMSVVPRQQKGDYFPAMRYGDEVVYAERMSDEQIFEDRKEAVGVRKNIAATDPTLDVQMLKTDDGRWAVRTFEREFVMAESVSEIEEAHARLVQDYGAENVFDPQKKRSKQTDSDIGSNQALNSIIQTLDGNPAAQAAIKNLYLRSLSEASFRKHEMKRKNRRGLNYDSQHRNLAAYAKQASYYTAQLEFGWKMAEALRGMDAFVSRRQAGDDDVSTRKLRAIVNHLHDRDQMSVDLPDIQQLVRKGVEYTHFFMLTSPSYWAINATQPWLVTAPTLAGRHGWGATISAMGDIQKLIKNPLIEQAGKTKGGFSSIFKGNKAKTEEAFDVIRQLEDHIKEHAPQRADAYIALLEKLRAEHIIDINVFTEMRDEAAGKKQNTRDRVIDASRIMAHLTEVNNRVLVALAAYQLEINAGETVEAATEYAGNIVSQTQFNYSSNNKPPLFQAGGPMGGVAPLLFQFMQWPQHMYAHLIRNYRGMVDAGVMNKSEARSALLGLLGTHAAVGGMVGMTLQPIKWAIGFTMMALGDDDEPYTFANAVSGRTSDRLMTSTFNDMFGTTVATFLSKGIPAGLGVDLSTRMSMGTLYFIDMRGDTAQSAIGSIVASFGGATLNQGINLGRGMGKIAQGDIMKGIEQMSPKIARDFLRSVRYYNEGLVNNAGDTVIAAGEMGFGEIVPQFFGFAPTSIAQFYEGQNAIKDAETFARDRKEELLRQFRLAEPTERRQVMSEVRSFNKANPQERIRYEALFSNVKGKKVRESRFRRYGANIDEKKARFYEKYADPYRNE